MAKEKDDSKPRKSRKQQKKATSATSSKRRTSSTLLGKMVVGGDKASQEESSSLNVSQQKKKEQHMLLFQKTMRRHFDGRTDISETDKVVLSDIWMRIEQTGEIDLALATLGKTVEHDKGRFILDYDTIVQSLVAYGYAFPYAIKFIDDAIEYWKKLPNAPLLAFNSRTMKVNMLVETNEFVKDLMQDIQKVKNGKDDSRQ